MTALKFNKSVSQLVHDIFLDHIFSNMSNKYLRITLLGNTYEGIQD